MAAVKSSLMQFRIDSELKSDAEELFRELGTSFAEALRIFARKCVMTRSMPIVIEAPAFRTGLASSAGAFAKYANPAKRKLEKGAFARAMEAKHAKAD